MLYVYLPFIVHLSYKHLCQSLLPADSHLHGFQVKEELCYQLLIVHEWEPVANEALRVYFAHQVELRLRQHNLVALLRISVHREHLISLILRDLLQRRY